MLDNAAVVELAGGQLCCPHKEAGSFWLEVGPTEPDTTILTLLLRCYLKNISLKWWQERRKHPAKESVGFDFLLPLLSIILRVTLYLVMTNFII